MADLANLKSKRTALKGKLTRFNNNFKAIDKEKIDENIVYELQVRLEKIVPLWEEFNELQYQIENASCTEESEYKSDEAERASFENVYFKLTSDIGVICSKFNKNRENAELEGSVVSSNSNSRNVTQSLIKLPPIKLPSFNGQYDSWLEFKDSFFALVHSNSDLTDIQKFYYLRSSLDKEVLEVIKSISVSESNYSVAWQFLNERYENKKLIIYNHIRAIFEYPSVEKESHIELRGLYDSVIKHLRSLKVLGEETDTWDRLIIYIMSNKFDSVTRREWESFKYQNDLPSMNDLNIFLRQKCEILEKIEISSNNESFGTSQKPSQRQFNKNNRRHSSSLAATGTGEQSNFVCYYCKIQGHGIFKCESFTKLNVDDRIAAVKKLKLCLNCLRDSHQSWNCKKPKCYKCGKAHNIILHSENYNIQTKNIFPTNGANNERILEPSGQSVTAGRDTTSLSSVSREDTCAFDCAVAGVSHKWSGSQVLLSTAIITLQNGKNSVTVRALLDSGSQSNFVTQEVCEKLGLKQLKINHTVKGVGQTLTNINNQVNVLVQSRVSSFRSNINCLVLPCITDRLPVISFDKNMLNIPAQLELADPNYNINGKIDCLLGSSVFWSVLSTEQVRLGPNQPVLQKTLLGWIIAGNLVANEIKKSCRSVNCLNINNESLNETIIKFWHLEEMNDDKQIFSESEKYCEDYFDKTTSRDDSGRLTVKIPFKNNVNKLGQSRETALKRFNRIEKKFSQDQVLKNEYVKFMHEYEQLGHMTETNDVSHDGYYLPHHAVFKNDSITTKCRVVFDASAKTSSGLSLNEVQFVGPTLQQDIFSILTRFRIYKYVLTGDISKMYRQILVHKDDTKYQKIFWRAQPDEEIKIYELNTVTYGTASAPYLAIKCLFKIAADNEVRFPEVSKIIKRDFYMDDLLTGANSETELLKNQRVIVNLLSEYGFELRKFLCNDQELLKKFEVNKDLEAGVLNIGEQGQNKTLGVYWDSNNDNIKYKINTENNIFQNKISKRTILSQVCQIFDPLGLLGPKIIVAKLIIQELWKLKIDWDSDVPSPLVEKWVEFYNDLAYINQLNIPRCVVFSKYISIELHGFSDASIKAYGACIYVRCTIAPGHFASSLLCAKSRVAPVKQITLPRLELCGALLLANLAKKVRGSLRINFNNCYFWTDSTITLFWIKSDVSRWKTFVANRVSEITSVTNSQEWNHVKTKENPADLLTRGESIRFLKELKLWWQGPEWFYVKNENWKLSEPNINISEIPDQRSIACIAVKQHDELDTLIKRFSSLNKTIRVLAYVKRFLSNIKLSDNKRIYGALLPEELENSLSLLIKNVQVEHFSREYECLSTKRDVPRTSKILSLNPFLHDGLLRVGGRLKNAEQPFEKRHPIILPTHHVLTNQIIRQEHERLLHCGVQNLLYSIRERYWPISGRNACKGIVKKCIKCFRAAPKDLNYLMGDLPDIRVNSFSVFLNVGTDFGGPFLLKDRQTRGAKIIKAYICLFICMSTKAIHIELVSGLTTEAFLAAFNRFVSRRGKPANVYSDNGLNFVGANNELTKLYEFLKESSEFIANKLAIERIKWHFIPARSPSFGGLWEAGIKSAKHHIKRVIGENRLTFEEFATVLTRIECILNSRPLCPLSQDPDDVAALTPAHFLIGRPMTNLPEIDIKHVPENRLSKWQHLQFIVQHYWTRWQKEYLAELQTRVKWKQNSKRLLKIGTLVLVKTENSCTLNWQLGRVVALYPGKDGVTRVVDIKVYGGVLKRAVNRVCALPIET